MRQPPSRVLTRGLAVLATTCLGLSCVATAQAATTNPGVSALEAANRALSQRAATEGMVLLENHDHALPMASRGNVAVFGVGAYVTVKGGTGSGAVNNRSNVTVRQGLEDAGYTVTTSADYWNAMTSAYDTKYPSTNSLFGPAVDYSSVEQPLTEATAAPTSATDTAIYVIARNSGEGADRSSGKGDYQLGDAERANLEVLGQTYKKVVVVLNTGGVMDTEFFKDVNAGEHDPAGGTALDSLLLMSQAGEQGGAALVQVLDGEVSPSGKLTDTWASSYAAYPASGTFGDNDGTGNDEPYSEGVYVGYRYFDSFYGKLGAGHPENVVNYPFGYGLSYADFSVEPLGVTADMDKVTVKARVTNVGTEHTGKEVVEVYVSAPQTGLDKPYQELKGYAKTDDLAPGDSQRVTVTFDTTSLASFDEDAARWVLDKGEYVVRVGDSSRNTEVAGRLELGADTPTELVNHELDATTPDDELTSDPADFYSYPGEEEQIAAAPKVTLDTTGFHARDDRSAYEQDVSVDESSPYYAYDGGKISSTTAYVDADQTDWEGTGKAYQPRTGESVEQVDADPDSTLYDVAAGRTSMEQFVAKLDVEQLANIVEGTNVSGSTLSAVGAAGYTTAKYESLGIPGMALSDGPAGLRLTQQINTTPKTYQWETAWPIGTMLAQTWNRALVKEVGDAVGKEMLDVGVTLWLAPGMNLHRDPLNGRNFEYYSEDPLVSGLTSAATTLGVQSNPGIGVTIKHYAFNDQETRRQGGNSVVGERAARELELRSFQVAVTTGQPMAVMSSYNRVNGTYAAHDYDLLTDILRGEWGFEGLVMTDWGGSHDATATMYSGNDLIEPGGAPGDIIKATRKAPPTIDVTGLPVYTKTTFAGIPSFGGYTWQFNGLTPSADGAETVSTTVDGTTDLSHPASTNVDYDQIFNQTVTPVAGYDSVDAAYRAVEQLVGGTALTAAQKAGITIADVVHQYPDDESSPVTAYTITIKGDYASAFPMRLGDLQRSAMRILDIVRQSAPFAGLAKSQGVAGVSVTSYDAQFDLPELVGSTLADVVKAPTGNAPTVTVSTTAPAPASGWFTGPVSVQTVLGNENDQAYVGIDGGETRPYTEPVEITGDGVHSVRVFATDGDGHFSAVHELTVRIDTTAPSVTAKGVAGRLVLTAVDDTSGVARIEYATDGGHHWATYRSPIAVRGASQTFAYRALDTAGNASASRTVTVRGNLALSKPVIAGTRKVGRTLHVDVTATPGATVRYQWLRNGHAVTRATGATYKVKRTDRGKKLSVTVTASARGLTAITRTSKAVRIKR